MWETISKFGLGHCDLPTVMWNISFLLRALTVNIDPRNPKRITIIAYIWTIVIGLSYFYVWFFSMTWFIFVRCRETGDLLAAICVFSLVVSSEIGTFKLLYMFLFNDTLKDIVAEYLACDAMVIPNSRFSKKLLEIMRYVKRRAMLFWIMIIGNGILYGVKPIFLSPRHFMDDLYTIYGLEPINESPNYEIGYLLQAGSISFICYPPANVTGFIIILAGYTEAQMLALSNEIVHLWDDSEQQYNEHIKSLEINEDNEATGTNDMEVDKNKMINKYVKQRLRRITIIHAKNIDLLRKVENVFRGAIVVEFVLLTIGITAELLGGLENTYTALPFSFVQVAMDCLTGQSVMDASLAFENAVYDCKWENFDVSNMKTVLLILQNSQKTMTLSAGGVAMLNFSCLMSIIRMIYSVYTALLTTMQ